MVSRCVLGPVVACLGAIVAGLAPASLPTPERRPVVWAWERSEDLRFAGGSVTIAVLAGTVTLSGPGIIVQPRQQPLRVRDSQTIAGVVHLEIDRTRPLPWTAAQRARTAAAVLSLLAHPRFTEAQIDFEVRASERAVLLDVLADVRSGLPAGRHLSMTALASWCDTETWIEAAPVDEVVPMLFRMGPAGESLKMRLASGGDFRDSRCRDAIGVAADTPPDAIPPGRRVWMFDPRPWTPQDLGVLRERLHA